MVNGETGKAVAGFIAVPAFNNPFPNTSVGSFTQDFTTLYDGITEEVMPFQLPRRNLWVMVKIHWSLHASGDGQPWREHGFSSYFDNSFSSTKQASLDLLLCREYVAQPSGTELFEEHRTIMIPLHWTGTQLVAYTRYHYVQGAGHLFRDMTVIGYAPRD